VTTITDRVALEQITREARQVRFGRVLLAMFAAVFFAVGWCAGRSVLAVAWCAVAVRVGWQEGRHGGGQPSHPQ
jgi:hypothetical protein